MKEDKHSKQKLWSVTDRPTTQAKPARLDWGQQSVPSLDAEEEKAEARSAEEDQTPAHNATSPPQECQAPR